MASAFAVAADTERRLEILLERPYENCFPCVVYRLEVFSDGSAKFHGIRGVKRVGAATGTIDAETLRLVRGSLSRLAEKAIGGRHVIEGLFDAGLVKVEYFENGVSKFRVEYQPVLSGEIMNDLNDVVNSIEKATSPYEWIR